MSSSFTTTARHVRGPSSSYSGANCSLIVHCLPPTTTVECAQFRSVFRVSCRLPAPHGCARRPGNLDNLALDELAATADRLKRWEFMLVVEPLGVENGAGAAINPVAIF